MIIVVPVCRHDADLAVKNLEWTLELEGGKQLPYTCLLAEEESIDYSKVENAASKLFARVDVLKYDAWQGSQKWPEPQNYSWQTVARHVPKYKEPWYWWEQDVTPLKQGWLGVLIDEYQRGRKPFMGHVVPNMVPGGHMNGAGFYPSEVSDWTQRPYFVHEHAFDVALSQGSMHHVYPATHLMGHFVKGKDRRGVHFENQNDFNNFFGVGSTLVCFHGCSDGSLIDVLRNVKPQSVTSKVVAQVATTKVGKKILSWVTRKNCPKIYHCLERHDLSGMPESDRRVRYAFNSWCALYKTGQVRACHLWDHDYPRDATTIEDYRRLPFLKDVLVLGLNACQTDDDMVMLTNDDTIILTGILPVLQEYMSTREAVSSYRINYPKGQVPEFSTPGPLIPPGKNDDIGRDLFCFRRRWLKKHWLEIPDFILGEAPWDLVLGAIIRKSCDPPLTFTRGNQGAVFDPAELPKGYVLHEVHSRNWVSPAGAQSKAKIWNYQLCNAWATEHQMPDLIQS